MTSRSQPTNQPDASIRWKLTLQALRRTLNVFKQPVTMMAIVLIAFAAFGGYNIRISLQQSELDLEVDALRASTAAGTPDFGAAEADKIAAESRYEDAIDSRLHGLSDARLSLSLIEIAESSSVTLTVADVEPETIQVIDGNSYPAMPFTVTGHGEIEDVYSFIAALEAGAISGLEIKNANVSGANEHGHEVTLRGYLYRQLVDAESD